jgi:hypothetical protein
MQRGMDAPVPRLSTRGALRKVCDSLGNNAFACVRLRFRSAAWRAGKCVLPVILCGR